MGEPPFPVTRHSFPDYSTIAAPIALPVEKDRVRLQVMCHCPICHPELTSVMLLLVCQRVLLTSMACHSRWSCRSVRESCLPAWHDVRGKEIGKNRPSTSAIIAVDYEHGICDFVAGTLTAKAGPHTGNYSSQVYIPDPWRSCSVSHRNIQSQRVRV